MSKENVKKFIEELQKKEAWQQQLKDANPTSQEDSFNLLVKLGGENGYMFSSQDLKEVRNEQLEQARMSGELDDSQLETVAGGSAEKDAAGAILLSLLSVGIVCFISVELNKTGECFVDGYR